MMMMSTVCVAEAPEDTTGASVGLAVDPPAATEVVVTVVVVVATVVVVRATGSLPSISLGVVTSLMSSRNTVLFSPPLAAASWRLAPRYHNSETFFTFGAVIAKLCAMRVQFANCCKFVKIVITYVTSLNSVASSKVDPYCAMSKIFNVFNSGSSSALASAASDIVPFVDGAAVAFEGFSVVVVVPPVLIVLASLTTKVGLLSLSSSNPITLIRNVREYCCVF